MSSLQEQKTLSSIMWNFARRNEHERLKSFLLEHSNDIDIEYCPVDGQGSCALLIAAGKGYYEIAELLIQYGSDTNAQNKDLESPLHRICGRGDTKMAELLLENGASINIIDDGNSTPLHILAATEFFDTLELIIQKSVPKYDKRDIGNRTAGDVAKICGNTAMEKILKAEEHNHAMMDRLFLTKLIKKVLRKWNEWTKKNKGSRLTKYFIDGSGKKVYVSDNSNNYKPNIMEKTV